MQKMAILVTCVAFFFSRSGALTLDASKSELVDQIVRTSGGFSMEAPPAVYNGVGQAGTVFLQDGASLSARENQVEQLARREQAALFSEQQALEAVARQQKQAATRTAKMEAQFELVQAKERNMEVMMAAESKALQEAKAGRKKAEVLLQEQSEALVRAKAAAASAALASTLSAGGAIVAQSASHMMVSTASNAAELGLASVELGINAEEKLRRDQLIGGAVYVVVMLVMAYIYGRKFTYEYPPLPKAPETVRDVSGKPMQFTFSLFEFFHFNSQVDSNIIFRDMRIPLFSCCCLPIRWADTTSAQKIHWLGFWTAVVTATVLNALAGQSYYITGILFTLLAAINRQRIRRIYGLPYGNFGTCAADFCTWTWCSCCATCQEAMQVEYVQTQARPWQQSMVDAANSVTDTLAGANYRQEKTACCA